MESRRLRMQATPRGGNTTPRRRLPAFVVEFNKAIVLLLLAKSGNEGWRAVPSTAIAQFNLNNAFEIKYEI